MIKFTFLFLFSVILISSVNITKAAENNYSGTKNLAKIKSKKPVKAENLTKSQSETVKQIMDQIEISLKSGDSNLVASIIANVAEKNPELLKGVLASMINKNPDYSIDIAEVMNDKVPAKKELVLSEINTQLSKNSNEDNDYLIQKVNNINDINVNSNRASLVNINQNSLPSIVIAMENPNIASSPTKK